MTGIETSRGVTALSLRDLTKEFRVGGRLPWSRRVVSALAGVDLDLFEGECLGVVGESGSGKTTMARIVVGLESPTSGEVLFGGRNIAAASPADRRALATEIQFVFQDGGGALNPRMRISSILAEPLRIHRQVTARRDLSLQVAELLELVGLDSSFAARWPRQLSGGQRQRIGIARALALRPKVLVLDEPVSALDVSVQAQIINVLIGLQRSMNISVLIISHDLALVSQVCDRVAVMYMGRVMEQGLPDELLHRPSHPYTAELVASVPRLDKDAGYWVRIDAEERADPTRPPSGCRYRVECPHADSVCADATPVLISAESPEHRYACHHPLRYAH